MTFTAGELAPADPVAERLHELEAAATDAVTFEFDGTVARVRFADPAAAALHRSRYRHLLSACEPAHTVCVAARESATYFWVPGAAAWRWDRHPLAAAETAFLADAVATTLVFESLASGLALHAAALAGPCGAAAVVGTSAAGKSTTALACSRAGLGLYSDEFCVVTPSGVVPFPRTLNLRRDGLERLASGADSASHLDRWLRANRGADRNDVGFNDLFGAWRAPDPLPLRVVFLASGFADAPHARSVPAAVMLPRVLPWTRMRPRGFEAAQALLRFLQPLACYELTLGTPDDTARLIARTLADAR